MYKFEKEIEAASAYWYTPSHVSKSTLSYSLIMYVAVSKQNIHMGKDSLSLDYIPKDNLYDIVLADLTLALFINGTVSDILSDIQPLDWVRTFFVLSLHHYCR